LLLLFHQTSLTERYAVHHNKEALTCPKDLPRFYVFVVQFTWSNLMQFSFWVTYPFQFAQIKRCHINSRRPRFHTPALPVLASISSLPRRFSIDSYSTFYRLYQFIHSPGFWAQDNIRNGLSTTEERFATAGYMYTAYQSYRHTPRIQ
jgi:hypothetical protein